jgi:plastocyanin
MRRAGSLAAAAALLLVSERPAAAAPHSYVVVIDKMKFGAVPAGVKVGDTILWVNRDMFRHTATATNGAFNIDLPAGAKGRTLIRRAGAIAFTCKYHPGMRGVVKVAK